MDQRSTPSDNTIVQTGPEQLPPFQFPSTQLLNTESFKENSFVVEDSFYRSRMPKATHWSVGWADLMMTMFILFLSMFVYQAAHKDFLVSKTPEIIGGSTTEALDVEGDQDLIVPIEPLTQTAPLVTSGTVRALDKMSLDEVGIDEVDIDEMDIDKVFQEKITSSPPVQTMEDDAFAETEAEIKKEAERETEKEVKTEADIDAELALAPVQAVDVPSKHIETEDTLEPESVSVPETSPAVEKTVNNLSEMYDNSILTLSENNLDKFASIELVPDKTMRIILTGDLLFALGQADLSRHAKESLAIIAAILKNTPYMVNVIGHTDNIPMHSAKFASNWELSVMRASSVTRFLVDEMKLNPLRLIISGYGSNRPRVPNSNANNRAANRRVEIIISKRLPPAVKATPTNLL